MERHLKGVSNHHRIDILFLVEKIENITLDEISDNLKLNVKTASEHTRRLVSAGLVVKKYRGRNVEHFLSPYGKIFIRFLKTFQYS